MSRLVFLEEGLLQVIKNEMAERASILPSLLIRRGRINFLYRFVSFIT